MSNVEILFCSRSARSKPDQGWSELQMFPHQRSNLTVLGLHGFASRVFQVVTRDSRVLAPTSCWRGGK